MSDSNTDNSTRKTAILIISNSEDLLTPISKVRSKQTKSSVNSNGYTPHRCIINEKGESETLNGDDDYLYYHGINR